ncbi:MAG: glycosyltransferase family 2 protein [Dehalococcoidales bacterium]|nr:glycosyltransferase family 2 protein [Dehalococcoidales bacterium]
MSENRSHAYILVSRVRDEAHFLPGLFESVETQSIPPALWVIVNHASKDNSGTILDVYSADKEWVEIVFVPADDEFGLFSHARPIRVGFRKALEYAREKGIPYAYLGIQDSDIVPEPAYYEKLLDYLGSSPDTGIAGGWLFLPTETGSVPEDQGTVVRGGSRLYRRECFESFGGEMPESTIWDSETDIMAELRGWKQAVIKDARALHKRKTSVRGGLFRGYWRRGRGLYYANYHPLYILLLGLSYMIKPPFIQGAWFLSSYVLASIKKTEQTKNPEVRKYCWNSYSRLQNKMKNRIKGFFRRN